MMLDTETCPVLRKSSLTRHLNFKVVDIDDIWCVRLWISILSVPSPPKSSVLGELKTFMYISQNISRLVEQSNTL